MDFVGSYYAYCALTHSLFNIFWSNGTSFSYSEQEELTQRWVDSKNLGDCYTESTTVNYSLLTTKTGNGYFIFLLDYCAYMYQLHLCQQNPLFWSDVLTPTPSKLDKYARGQTRNGMELEAVRRYSSIQLAVWSRRTYEFCSLLLLSTRHFSNQKTVLTTGLMSWIINYHQPSLREVSIVNEPLIEQSKAEIQGTLYLWRNVWEA